MKKLLAIFLVAAVLFTFASCGGNETDSSVNNDEIVENNNELVAKNRAEVEAVSFAVNGLKYIAIINDEIW